MNPNPKKPPIVIKMPNKVVQPVNQQTTNHKIQVQSNEVNVGTIKSKLEENKKPANKVENDYELAPSIKYQHILNGEFFRGEYQQRNTPYYQAKFKALNGLSLPLIPLRVKDCNKLACIFDDKPQTKVFKCCSKKQYNNQQLVLDWRLAAVMKNVEKELSVPNQQWSIILLNNKVILRNETNKFEYHENIWVEGFLGEQLQDYRSFIKNQIKGNCEKRLSKYSKLDQQLQESTQLYQEIINQTDYKNLKKNIRDANSEIYINNQFVKQNKPGMMYVETINNTTRIYLVSKNSKVNVYPVKHLNNNPKQFFRNNKNEILSLSKNYIYKYTLQANNQQKQQGILQQELLYTVVGNFGQLGKGGKIIYSAMDNALYVIGGQKAPKRFHSIKLIGKAGQLKYNSIDNLVNCQTCKVTIGGDGSIYILPQSKSLQQNFNSQIYIFQLPPGGLILKVFKIQARLQSYNIFFDDNSIFSTIFIDGKPCLYLINYDYQAKKCSCATIFIDDLEKNPHINIIQITNCPKFCKNNWINDSLGSVLANSTKYLAKVEIKQGIHEVKEVCISGQRGFLTWKVISY